MEKRLKVLIYTNHFYPEFFRVNDLAFELAKDADVSVITCVPNYPKGRYFEGYGLFKRNREVVRNVKIIRLPLLPRYDGGSINIILNYITYALSTLLYTLYLILSFRKFDRILIHHTSPIFIAIPAVLFSRIRNIKLIFWNLDLWPESVKEASKIKSIYLINFLGLLVNWIYRNVDLMLISSRGFHRHVVERGMRPNKVIYFPNWTESEMAYEGSEVKQCPFQFKGCFNIVYTGNIGEAQDFSNVLEAFSYLKNPLIHLYLVGNGRAYDLVKSKIEELNLQEVVYLLGQVKPEIVPSVIAEADAVLLSLKSAEIFSVTVPAKLQVYLTAGKPILGMVSGEAKAIIDESNAGYCVEAGDYIGLSMIIKRMSELSTQDITIMGKNGADYSQSVFERKTLLDIAVKLIHEK